MNDIKIFENEKFGSVRVVERDGEPMNEIIKVNYDNDRITVSARDLHEFLEVGSEFSHWFKRMCEYGFSEGVDFSSFLTESSGGRPAKDAQLTIDMAKEICMLQRNEKGRQARQYFIQLEKDWNTPEKVMARALVLAHKEIDSVKQTNVFLMGQLEEQKPLVEFANRVSNTDRLISVGEMAKLLKDKGFNVGRNKFFEYLRDNKILMGNNVPYQKYIDAGYFHVRETSNRNGGVFLTTYVTGKGQMYLVDKVKNLSK